MNPYSPLPFHFFTAVFFIFGSMVGSFLNVCIHRMPRGESVVTPRSHCPHCGYSIPWHLNVPILTWLVLRGKCANCGAGIAVRYVLVELLTGCLFAVSWLVFGMSTPGVAIVNAVVLAAFVTATFIDLEHFIIPDEITLGGIIAGLLASFLVPEIQGVTKAAPAMKASLIGAVVGGGMVYFILRLGKLLFGRQKIALPEKSSLIFTETALILPDQAVPYEEIFYRKSDTIKLEAVLVELPDRCYRNVSVRLSPEKLSIGEDHFEPEQVPFMGVQTSQVVLPREAMGLGDVKFMAAIGAFMGWHSTVFSLMFSAILGSAFGVTTIALGRREWSSRIPYGPYIAAAAILWMFLPPATQGAWKEYLGVIAETLGLLFGRATGRTPVLN